MIDQARWEHVLLAICDRFSDDMIGERDAVHVYAWLHRAVTGPLWESWLNALNLLRARKPEMELKEHS